MPLARFLRSAHDSGRVRVRELSAEAASSPLRVDPGDVASLHETLDELHRTQRLHLAEPIPKFDRPSARWATVRMYRAAQLIVSREVGEETIAGDLAVDPAMTVAITPGRQLGVDLAFVFLPDLRRLAALRSPSDPLVRALDQLGLAWPLSSIGMPIDLEPAVLDALLDHPTTARLAIDRMVERNAHHHLTPRFAAEIVAELGLRTGALGAEWRERLGEFIPLDHSSSSPSRRVS
ncbi:MAG: hypothetical protein AAF488_04040 [Planctomycetota bacterium]